MMTDTDSDSDVDEVTLMLMLMMLMLIVVMVAKHCCMMSWRIMSHRCNIISFSVETVSHTMYRHTHNVIGSSRLHYIWEE